MGETFRPDPESIGIIKYPHPTLRTPAHPIVRVDAELRAIAKRMIELMYEAKGVGLAAPQVNLPLRMFVMNPSGDPQRGSATVIINPEVQLPKGNESSQEGCLSLPGVYGDVRRPKKIRLSAYDIDGRSIDRVLDGFEARVVQHETDHLDGVLFFDRINDEARVELEESLGELEDDFQNRQRRGEVEPDDALLSKHRPWLSRYAQA